MALQEFFDRMFVNGKVSNPTEAMIRHLWITKLEETEKTSRADAQRLLDWYNRNTVEIIAYLKEAAKKTFDSAEIKNWQWPLLNGVPRMINRMSLAYKQAPERKLFRGTGKSRTEIEAGDEIYEIIYGQDGAFRNIDIDKKFKEMDRYSNLFNTLHTEVVPRKGAIDWDIRLKPQTIVVPDPEDCLTYNKIAFAINLMDPDTLIPYSGWIYWSKDFYAMRLSNQEWVGMANEEGLNPYGIIPVVVIRKLEQDDYWGAVGSDLVDGFEKMNIQFAQTWETAIMQTFGVPVGINLGLKPEEDLKIGPRKPVTVEDVGKDEVEPSLKFVKPDNDIEKLTDLIDFYLQTLSNSQGLPPGSWSMTEIPESGFAKFMNNIESIEMREDGIAAWKKREQELFNVSRTIHNYYAKEWKVKPIPDDVNLEVIFPAVKIPESPLEKTTRYVAAKAAGLTSPVRYYMEEHGLDRDKAMELVELIQEELALSQPKEPTALPFNEPKPKLKEPNK